MAKIAMRRTWIFHEIQKINEMSMESYVMVFFVGHKVPMTIAFLYISYESVAKLTTYEKPLFLSVLLAVTF